MLMRSASADLLTVKAERTAPVYRACNECIGAYADVSFCCTIAISGGRASESHLRMQVTPIEGAASQREVPPKTLRTPRRTMRDVRSDGMV